MTLAGCPPEDELRAFLVGDLPEPASAAVAGHLDACPACASRAERIERATDTFVGVLRRPVAGTRLPAAGPDWTGRTGYELLGELGRGGMGVVYKARHRELGRLVALKQIRGEFAASLTRFRAEAEAAAKLLHPNIVQVYEVGEHDGRPFLALEFVDGPPLDQSLAGQPLPPRDAAALLEPVARAVHFAHEHGIVHRDLKPANILLTADRVPKLTDFGIAKRLDAGDGPTRTGELIGTPCYMAPEQAGGPTDRVGPAVDVYALGVILYELLTGRVPHRGTDAVETLLLIRTQDPVPPRRLQPKVPRDLETVCLKCLEKDPARRYASAEALADDLKRFLAGEPTAARPVGAVERAWKWARRRKAAAAVVALAAFLLVVGLPTVTGLWLWADHERRQADKARGATAEALDRNERSSYLGHVAQADFAFYRIEMPTVRAHLRACEPAPGRPDRRGWEWFYLDKLARSELLALTPPAPIDARERALYAVAFSRDGRWVVAGGGARNYNLYTGDDPGELVVWDTAARTPVGPVIPAPRGVTAAAFGPDGTLYTVGVDTKRGTKAVLRATDPRTGTVRFEREETYPVSFNVRPLRPTLTVSPDGSRLAVGRAGGVVVRDAHTGKELFDCPWAVAGEFTADGAEFRTVGVWGRLRAYDAATGAVRSSAGGVGVTAPGHSYVFSPSARLVAWTERDGDVVVAPTDQPDRRFRVRTREYAGRIEAVVFGPDDRPPGSGAEPVLATAGADAAVRVWDVASGEQKLVYRGHDNRVTDVAFSPDGRSLASVGWDRAVKVWDATRPQERLVFGGPPGTRRVQQRRAEDLVFTPDGRTILAARTPGAEVEWWDATTGEPRRPPTPLGFAATPEELVVPGRTSALSAGGVRLAGTAAGRPAQVKLWDVAAAREVTAFPTLRAKVRYVAVSPDGSRVAAAAWYRPGGLAAELCTLTGFALAGLLDRAKNGGPAAELCALAGLLDCTRDGPPDELCAWDDTGAELLRVPLDREACPVLAFSPDGNRLVAAIRPNIPDAERVPVRAGFRVRVWDLGRKAVTTTLDCDDDVTAVTFDPTGRLVAATTARPRLLICDAGTGEVVHSAPCVGTYSHLAFSPDGKRLAGATRELVTLWDATSLEEALTLRGRPRTGADPLFNPRVAFSPDGTRLAASLWDFTINVWAAEGYPAPRE